MPGHMATDPPPGARTEERDCPDCGKRTVWFHAWQPGWNDELGKAPTPAWWEWRCTALTADDIAAGR